MSRLNFFLGYILFALVSCGMEEGPEPKREKYQGVLNEQYLAYQIKIFYTGPLEDNVVSVLGEFGGIPIKAGKANKNEVVFIVPNLPAGAYQLKLKIGHENRVWDVNLIDSPIEADDVADFWSVYFAGSAVINDSLENYPELRFYADDAKGWSKYFETQFSGLSQAEKSDLISVIYRNGLSNLIPFTFEAAEEFENCLKSNFSIYHRNFVEVSDEERKLKAGMVYLTPSKLNDALLAFTVDMIWRHSAVIDMLSYKLLACPILRYVSIQTIYGIVDEKPISFNSGDSLQFKLTGEYIPLNSSDQSLGSTGLGFYASLLNLSKTQSKANAAMISSLLQFKDLDLPRFPEVLRYSIQGYVPSLHKPLIDYKVEFGGLSNPEVILSRISQNDDLLFLTFEKKNDESQDFQFSLTFSQFEISVLKNLKGTLPDISNLILDLSFDSGTANLQILSGQEPYTIFWSNGVTNETQVKFSAGNYSVKVKDANGFEKGSEFSIPEFGTVKDREGNEYLTVKIGERWWMAENLRNTIREDGRSVKYSESWPSWNPSFPPDFDHARYSYYQNNPENDKRYGKLYTHPGTVCCLCPEGWEMPTFEDFTELADNLGGLSQVGRILKSRSNWKESIFNSTNESGFNAKPGGMKYMLDRYQDEEVFVGWWAVGGNFPNEIVFLEAGNNELKLVNRISFYAEGHYIRCIKKK
jgi:uncharacterized protein (TIGR02145 family)